MLGSISQAANRAAKELVEKANVKSGQTVIVGCSTSEIAGFRIGTHSNAEIGVAVFDSIFEVFRDSGIILAAQCCEHLNRAIVVDRKYAPAGFELVNAVPTPHAGGAFAAAAYNAFTEPVVIESIRADAGLDIGGTMIGMHLKRVVIALRLETQHIGSATVTGARTRPPLIGGSRAEYNSKLF